MRGILRHTAAVLTVVAGTSTTVITGIESASVRVVGLVNGTVDIVAASSVTVTVS